VRLACVWLQRDYIGVETLVRDMIRQGREVHLEEADRAWTGCAETFSAATEFVEAAKIRLAIARAQIKGENLEARRRTPTTKAPPA
jgi:hypothetical protein